MQKAYIQAQSKDYNGPFFRFKIYKKYLSKDPFPFININKLFLLFIIVSKKRLQFWQFEF